MAVNKDEKADANPTKSFFVHMITRDITLEDCILDLVDNSVDGARELLGGKSPSLNKPLDLTKFRIDISVSPEAFRIIDNCGGITLDEAARYAFTFGRKDEQKHEKYSIGVYGIGMKRAVFKIGNSIVIKSTYLEKNGAMESFAVPINVEAWLAIKKRDWDFDIEPTEHLPEPGVEIGIKELHEEAGSYFGSPAFVQNLIRTLGRDYALLLRSGLALSVNDSPVKGWQIELLGSDVFTPIRVAYDDEVDGTKVSVELVAGMSAQPPESQEPDEKDENEQRSGWYVACNGRIVLAADRTTLTGWGTDDWPKWHPQYAGFLGFVFFASTDAAKLPLTTTKRSIDKSSGVYRRAQSRMRELSKQWIAYTNVRKQDLENAKQLEEKAKPISVFDLKRHVEMVLPKLTPKKSVPVAHIAYSMPREKVRSLAEGLGNINMSYRDVGIKSFDYTYGDYVGDE